MEWRRLAMAVILSVPLCYGQRLKRPSPMPAKTSNPAVSPLSATRRAAPQAGSPAADGRDPVERAAAPPRQLPDGRILEKGQASFYSPGMNGRLTASGEVLNNDELLGAHPRHPLGSKVKVTNLANGKSVVVRIVDRGPNTPGRVMNVSHSAARQLDMLRAGVAEVEVEFVPEKAGQSGSRP